MLSYIKRNKRKTIQFFLDDIRRIRNRFAHNKDITLSQLELLNIYYEELVAPIGQFHEHGHTKVNPNEFLDVTQEELNEYFSSIKEDMMEVKETIEDLKKFNVAMVDKYEDKYEEYEKANAELKEANTQLTLNVDELKTRLFGSFERRLKAFALRPDKKKDN